MQIYCLFLLFFLLILVKNFVEAQTVTFDDDDNNEASSDVVVDTFGGADKKPTNNESAANDGEGRFFLPGFNPGLTSFAGAGFYPTGGVAPWPVVPVPADNGFMPGITGPWPSSPSGTASLQGMPGINYNPYYPSPGQQPGIFNNNNNPPTPFFPPMGQSTGRPNYQNRAKCGVRPAFDQQQQRRLKRHLFYQLMKHGNEDDPEGAAGRFYGAFNDDNGVNTLLEPSFDSGNSYSIFNNDNNNNNNDGQEETPRIVGGRVTTIEYWPWQVSLRYNEGHICGGSIVSSRYVVTATHCFRETSRNPADWTVYAAKSKLALGEPGEVGPVEVESIRTNPNYGKLKRFDSDIALVRLKTPLRFSEKIFPICLPQQGAMLASEGLECYITGYGETKGTGGQGSLKEATVPIIAGSRCGQMNMAVQKELTNNMICAAFAQGGTDTCQGDSGGPLVCRSASSSRQFILQGVVSFGFGCAGRNSPGIYARVANYVDWIKWVTQRHM